ncbi:hypothetical protein EYF80_018339 [Liparis tanakae]|uniref:Uncharacterized protein n=1 Tax=Liparis tanakae TaxID=230148 RepID=A0A4Z2I0R9_9TELE|nr:hypothetical protein EYF80_018339 [Liparis tanakae]
MKSASEPWRGQVRPSVSARSASQTNPEGIIHARCREKRKAQQNLQIAQRSESSIFDAADLLPNYVV